MSYLPFLTLIDYRKITEKEARLVGKRILCRYKHFNSLWGKAEKLIRNIMARVITMAEKQCDCPFFLLSLLQKYMMPGLSVTAVMLSCKTPFPHILKSSICWARLCANQHKMGQSLIQNFNVCRKYVTVRRQYNEG